MMLLRSGDKLLFMGDSITECLRDTVEPPLGAGFVQFTRCLLAARHPDLRLEFLNRGVSGETIRDLERRWDRDAIASAPHWLFLMIGVNDVLYRHIGDKAHRAVTDAEYRDTLLRLIERTRSALDCRIVLLEPTPLEEAPDAASHAIMRHVVDVVNEVGRSCGIDVVPVFDRFLDAVRRGPRPGWMIDVPHPSLKGHFVITLALLDYLGW